MVNKNISNILGSPNIEDEIDEVSEEPIMVSATELVPMTDDTGKVNHKDIDIKILEAEKMVDRIANLAYGTSKKLLDQIGDVQPSHRARNIEVANEMLKLALDSTKTKISTQEKKRDQRMKSAKEQTGGNFGKSMNVDNMNVVIGSHSDILKSLGDDSDD